MPKRTLERCQYDPPGGGLAMMDFLVAAYKIAVALFAAILMVASISAGVLILRTEAGPPLLGWAILLGGPAAIILVFGTLALMIQNNALLRRIAELQEAADRRGKALPPEMPGQVTLRAEPRLR